MEHAQQQIREGLDNGHRIVAEHARLEQERARLEQDRARLDRDRANFERDRARWQKELQRHQVQGSPAAPLPSRDSDEE